MTFAGRVAHQRYHASGNDQVSLSSGRRIGIYEILAPIGAGGMGEVYRARDTRLNRDVALKILPDTFAIDPSRVARFRREAQVLATLNHANIGQIYGLEEISPPSDRAPAATAIVLELDRGSNARGTHRRRTLAAGRSDRHRQADC